MKKTTDSLIARFFALFMLLILLPSLAIFGQRTITGSVVDAESNEPLTGASVIIKGTTSGTIADSGGSFTINAEQGDVLQVSFVGYRTREIEVETQQNIQVTMEPDRMGLEDVVVVGYGTQRAQDLTASIVTIRNEELSKSINSQAMHALQGKVAGVHVVSSGAPGTGPRVRIRGVGSLPGYGDSDPLYVVDGMFYDNIDFLNTSDIASISVLKDVSLAAIYGVRAANGVVLIETTSGQYNQKTEIVYNGYYGLQVTQNVPEMSDTELFTKYVNETGDNADLSFIQNSIDRYGGNPDNPNLPAVNTDWYDEILRIGPMQNHSLSINGGTDKIKYSVGANYFNQKGLLNVVKNEYERTSFRTKIDFKATDRLTIGGNVNISNATRYDGPQSVWFLTYFAVPTLPVYDKEDFRSSPEPIASAKTLGYRKTQNPFFELHYNNDRYRIGDILGNFHLNYDILPDVLSFKMTYNYNYGTSNSRIIDFAYNDGEAERTNALSRQSLTRYNQIWDNILTYKNSFGQHNLTIMTGYSYRSEQQEGVFARATEIQGLERENEELWFINNSGGVAGLIDDDGTGDIGSKLYGVSYLGRMAYNFNHKYLFYGTYRRDGTNKFQAKWGNFFTFGAGWVISSESFFNIAFVDYLKIRASWGELGNDAIKPAVGQPTRGTIYAAFDDTRHQGLTVDNDFDLIDRWETVVETNVGLTGSFFSSRFSVDADYYQRDTRDAVTLLRFPGKTSSIRRNLATIRNSGFELDLRWSDKINKDFSYSIGGNLATLTNEVLDLGPGPGYLGDNNVRTIEGESILAYFGYEVEGVFQSEAEIQSKGYTEEFISNFQIEPGDLIFRDQNNDGIINSDDRVVLGSYLPKVTYGGFISVSYNNFDLSLDIHGQAGHKIYNRKRAQIVWDTDPNIDAELARNLWRGKGTSNKYPSAKGLRKGYNNQQMSEYYLQDGSFFRIQNIRLAYNFIDKRAIGSQWPHATIFITAEKPITISKYNKFSPEVMDGYDMQTYPLPTIYTVGLNLKF